jgi:rubredoxin
VRMIKSPKFNACECIRCGTIFQPEWHDNLLYEFDEVGFNVLRVYIECPTCGKLVEVPIAKEGETNA